jgi:hypothetical protein
MVTIIAALRTATAITATTGLAAGRRSSKRIPTSWATGTSTGHSKESQLHEPLIFQKSLPLQNSGSSIAN